MRRGSLRTLLADVPQQPTGYGVGEAPLLLARAYYHSAQLGPAERAARELAEADPTDAYAALLLSRTLQRLGRHDEAAAWRRRSDALTGTHHDLARTEAS